MQKVMMAITTLGGGGAERVVSVWANQLKHTGYEVSLLLFCRIEQEYPIDPDVTVYTVASTNKEYVSLSYFERLKRMRGILKTVRPDVLINFLPPVQIWMMVASWGMNVRRIETVRNNPWVSCHGMEKILWKRCFSRSNVVIVQTAEQAEFFKKKIQQRCVVIPNPIEERYCDHPKTEYADRVTRFVAAGRLDEQKNYAVMIEAFKRACDRCASISLDIYGAGGDAYRSEIQKKIDDLKLSDQVRLKGRTADMSSVYREADAFLMTSDFEGMPNALAEAMVSGLVCVSTNCRTGPRDMIEHEESGFLVKVGDASEIARAIVKVAGMSREQCEKMGSNARERILSLFGEENSLRQLIQVIEGQN